MNKKTVLRLAAYALGVALAFAVTGCAGHSPHDTPQAKASISALASIPGADAKAMLVKAGVPVNGTSAQQLAFARSMLVKTSRDQLAAKLEIPRASRAAFEASLLDAARTDHLRTHAGRVKFLDADLPGLVARYQWAS